MRTLSVVLLLSGLAAAQSSVPDLLEQKTAAQIRKLDESLGGVLGLTVIDLNTGRTFAYHGDTVFPAASTIQVAIMAEVFRSVRSGDVKLDQPVKLTPAEAAGGDGRLQLRLKKGALTLTVRELMRAMIEDNDKTAANKLIELVRMDEVNGLLASLGLRATRLRSRMMDSAAASRNEEDVSTPLEMARLFELIYRGKVVDEDASREMLDTLKLVKGDIRKAVPQNVEVASKPGDLPGVRCETGIVLLPGRPYVVSIMSTFLKEPANPAPEAASLINAYFEKLASSNSYGHRIK